MSLIHYKDLAGSAAAFNSANFIRLRPSFGESEPADAITLRTDKSKFHSASGMDEIVTQLQAAISIMALTTPVGLTVWIAKSRLIDVAEASQTLHHPNARSVLTLLVNNGPTIIQQARETVEQVVAAAGPD